jgi:Fe-S-cluster containining protein
MSETLHWRCISGCGSCCRLDPEEREEALEALTAEQQQQYLAMVGPDGWCIHYDTGSCTCSIYDQRPMFCRVENLATLFNVAPEEANAFAIACCRQQIRSEHGGRGIVMKRFEQAIRQPAEPAP